MKHRTIKLLLLSGVVLCTMMFSSCGVSDWIYDLPNDYSIWSINVNDIALIKEVDELSENALDRYIIEFCYNDAFVGIKRLSIN